MTNQKSLVKNTAIIALGKLSTQFLTFLLLPLYTHYLSVKEFGNVDLIITYISLLTPIITLQVEMATFRFLIDHRQDKKQITSVITNATQIAGGILTIFTAVYIPISIIFNIPYAAWIICAIAATIAANMFLQIARGLGDNVKYAIGGVIAGATTITSNIVLIAGVGWGVEGLLTSIILANVACAIYLFFALKLHTHITLKAGSTKLKKQLLGYSGPLVPNGVAWWLINAADRTIITIILGAASNGIYAVAYKFPLIFSSLFGFFGLSWTEAASVHINSPDRDKFFSETINNSLRFFGALGACIIAAIPFVFGFLVNSRFHEAYLYIPILIVGAFFNAVVGLYSAIYIAKKMTKQVASTSIFAAVISILITLVFTSSLGIYAAAYAMAISYGIMALYRAVDLRKHVSLSYSKTTLLGVGALYIVSNILYYQQRPILNIINAILVGCFALYLNKHMAKFLKQTVLNRRLINRGVSLED